MHPKAQCESMKPLQDETKRGKNEYREALIRWDGALSYSFLPVLIFSALRFIMQVYQLAQISLLSLCKLHTVLLFDQGQ